MKNQRITKDIRSSSISKNKVIITVNSLDQLEPQYKPKMNKHNEKKYISLERLLIPMSES